MRKEKEKKKNKKEEKKKVKLFPLLLLLVFSMSLIFSVVFFKGEPEKVEYVAFLEQVEKEEIEEIIINPDKGEVEYEIGKKRYYTNYPYTDNFIENMLLLGVDVDYKHNINISSILSPLSSVGVVLITFFIVKTLFKEVFKNVDVGQKVDSATHNVSFSDIAGMDEIKEDMLSLAELIKNKEYREKGVIIPKGILLDGPPGNGKTLLARAFAGECGLNFIALNASDFESKYIGVASEKINKVFADAQAAAPCIVFIDEIDAIGSKRMAARTGAEKEFNSVLTTLLGKMDGFTPSDDIFVMAATNRASDLDEALVRPGRFDRKFTIGYPDKKTRYELLILYTQHVELASDVNLDNIVAQTYGCSSAKIKSIINEAIINSVMNKREEVTNEDFSNAIIRMTLNGVERKTERWEGKTRDIIAYHEAGHAVIAHLLGKTVTNVSIIPTTASAGGYTLVEEKEEELTTLSDYRNTITTLYGGRAAETILAEDSYDISIGASNDIKEATRLASSMVNFADGIDYSSLGEHGTKIIVEKTKEELEKLWERTLSIAEENWEDIEKVAEELKIEERISGEEFLKLVN